ncbi:MAG: PIN domain-containing protein [Trichodesmium sp. MO_231.B1]|nr:PIN domain-containing protein [Trichodesmium sp. MO_231.B1]
MKNLFSWRLPLSEANFAELWEKATFVFDTNFLLDFYRVSSSTSQDYFRILEHIKDRIWLPYQVADEFFEHREEIIDKEKKSFEYALSELEQWKVKQKKFDSLKGSISQAGRIVASEIKILFDEQKSYFDAVDQVEKNFREKIERIKNNHYLPQTDEDNILEDKILEKILSLFDSKVGKFYDEINLSSLYKEADRRYQQLKPPGFMDRDKTGAQKYGDFILWRQILDFAKENSLPIIFVTGDKKKDWWNKKNGNIISPHIELRREFKENVKQQFWMYTIEHFIEYAKDKFQLDIDSRSMEETNQIADDKQVSENKREFFEQMDISEAKIMQMYDNPYEQMYKIAELREQERNRINEEIKKFEQMKMCSLERMLKIAELREQEQDLTFL